VVGPVTCKSAGDFSNVRTSSERMDCSNLLSSKVASCSNLRDIPKHTANDRLEDEGAGEVLRVNVFRKGD